MLPIDYITVRARSFLNTLGLLSCGFLSVCGTADGQTPAGQRVDFNRDVRPLLSDRCFACHGFDESSRATDLRLDTLSGATADLGGTAAVVPGEPEASELIRRITAEDPEERMPPVDSHRPPLTAEQAQTLSDWIAQGAPWGEHWSFVKPVQAEVPPGMHPVDYFVSEKLLEINNTRGSLSLAPTASPATLVRRLSLDLVGLPPEKKQVAEFMAQADDQHWDQLIDSYLASPHFGERMAMWWLDGARYSDTDGFQADATRQNWPWRDWVIEAFNKNMPFDRFTIEQFAGDLLPEASDAQRLATCFHRNHMHNGEGGRDPEESRVDYVLDRVNTAGTLWLGLTLGCTQCHDHKFDPISQRDYYSLSAYFNSIDETGQAGSGAKPFLSWTAPTAQRSVALNGQLAEQLQRQLAERRESAQEPFAEWLQKRAATVASGFEAWRPLPVLQLDTTEGYQLRLHDQHVITAAPNSLPQDDYVITCGPPPDAQRITAIRLEVFPDASHTDGKLSHSPSGEFILTNFKLRLRRRGSAQYRELAIASATSDVDGQGKDSKYAGVAGTLDDDPRTGWTTRNHPADQTHWAMYELAQPLSMSADEELDVILMQRSIENRELIGRFALTFTDVRGEGIRSRKPLGMSRLAEELSHSATPDVAQISDQLASDLFDEFLEDDTAYTQLTQQLELVQQQLRNAQQAAGELKVTVLKERAQPRSTYVLERGVWDAHGEEVTPGVLPAVLAWDSQRVPTRLELGEWFVSPDNPLTARVIVNQIWQLLFGAGLVRTPDDFGLQGELPTHPRLLDWLAVEFMQSGWNVKHLIKTIVTSQTYRRSSVATPRDIELDPQNLWLARGARFRLPSWMIRDMRLAMSGQLLGDVGGPPVFPYQPAGVWEDQFMGRIRYQATLGPEQYRRTIYAFWRRSSPPAFLFDAPQRRSCEVTQVRTNTPLQALNLLNDMTGQEVARSIADQTIKGLSVTDASPHGATSPAPLDVAECWDELGYRILNRSLSDQERQILQRQYETAFSVYHHDPQAARQLLTVGQLPPPGPELLAERAALMVIVTTLLNLDECITHE